MIDRKKDLHPCSECGVATDLRGWLFIMPKSNTKKARKTYRWWCKRHYLEWMFGLWPYECTAACNKVAAKKGGFVGNAWNFLVWVDLVTQLAPAAENRTAFKPLCPCCGERMRAFDIKKQPRNKQKK